ncbi:cellulose binding domain-containing protein [Amycolatopsis sp. WAC 04169]|uniref:cellulose binding domain-containing protein n=1 Tax=Amycolatopsis sp. WAC 04169 TaxID=2203197 RepID=UPI001F42D3BF|nr:cellulose binding domain-containing protein [Amycolatopsis sp. WAC 04169]
MTRKRLLAAIAATAPAAGLFGAVVTAEAAAPSLTATFAQGSVWDSGYGGKYTLTNAGDANSTQWTMEFDLPEGTAITTSWSSVLTRTGQHYKVTNAAFNGTIKPGGTASFGFNTTGLGLPSGCTINGSPCGGGAPTTTTTPPSPTSTSTSPPTTTTSVPSGDVVDVGTAAELQAALAAASPGRTIRLAAGTYRGSFVATKPGTAAAPITVTGPSTAVLINDGPSGEALPVRLRRRAGIPGTGSGSMARRTGTSRASPCRKPRRASSPTTRTTR